MIPKVIDKREIWLDEVSIEAIRILSKMQNRKLNGLTLSDDDRDFRDVASGYVYLLKLCKEYGLFESDDPFNLFDKETLH